MKVDISFVGNTAKFVLLPENEEEWIKLEEIIRRLRLGFKVNIDLKRPNSFCPNSQSIPRYQETNSDSYRYELR